MRTRPSLNVYLRALEPDDHLKSHRWRNDESLWAQVVGRRYFVSSEYEKNWVYSKITDAKNEVNLAVCLIENDQHIGYAYLRKIDFFNKKCESGRLIGDPEHRGKGYGTQTSFLLLKHAFYDLGLERVYSRQLCYNIASIRSLEKVGYKIEGRERKSIMKNGKLEDANLMGCLRSDFEEVFGVTE